MALRQVVGRALTSVAIFAPFKKTRLVGSSKNFLTPSHYVCFYEVLFHPMFKVITEILLRSLLALPNRIFVMDICNSNAVANAVAIEIVMLLSPLSFITIVLYCTFISYVVNLDVKTS